MASDSLGRRFERRFLRPFMKWVKRPFAKASSGSLSAGQAKGRIELLEQKVAQLEALVREDLGLRYLALDAKEAQSQPLDPKR
jgi:hypothetical protein